MKAILLLFLYVLISLQERVVYIGKIESVANIATFNMSLGLDVGVDFINDHADIRLASGERVKLKVVEYYYDVTSEKQLRRFAKRMVDDVRFKVMIYVAPLNGDFNSHLVFADVVERKGGILLLANDNNRNLSVDYDNAYSFGIPTQVWYRDALKVLDNRGAKSYAVIKAANDSVSDGMSRFIEPHLAEFENIKEYHLSANINTNSYKYDYVSSFPPEERAKYRNIAEFVVNNKPDVVIWTPGVPLGTIVLALEIANIESNGYFPKSILSWGFIDDIYDEDLLLATYITFVYWIPNTRIKRNYDQNGYERYEKILKMKKFEKLYFKNSGAPFVGFNAAIARQQALCAVAIAESYNGASSTSFSNILNRLKRLTIPTSEGDYIWYGNHVQGREPNVIQVNKKGKFNMILPTELSDAIYVYPIPRREL